MRESALAIIIREGAVGPGARAPPCENWQGELVGLGSLDRMRIVKKEGREKKNIIIINNLLCK